MRAQKVNGTREKWTDAKEKDLRALWDTWMLTFIEQFEQPLVCAFYLFLVGSLVPCMYARLVSALA